MVVVEPVATAVPTMSFPTRRFTVAPAAVPLTTNSIVGALVILSESLEPVSELASKSTLVGAERLFATTLNVSSCVSNVSCVVGVPVFARTPTEICSCPV